MYYSTEMSLCSYQVTTNYNYCIWYREVECTHFRLCQCYFLLQLSSYHFAPVDRFINNNIIMETYYFRSHDFQPIGCVKKCAINHIKYTYMCNNIIYCDLRGRIKGAAHTLYPVYLERANIVRTIYAILARWCALFRISMGKTIQPMKVHYRCYVEHATHSYGKTHNFFHNAYYYHII